MLQQGKGVLTTTKETAWNTENRNPTKGSHRIERQSGDQQFRMDQGDQGQQWST